MTSNFGRHSDPKGRSPSAVHETISLPQTPSFTGQQKTAQFDGHLAMVCQQLHQI
ncbi:MAG: hypothetical protein HC799_04310 [Limnothrix sp. RL_2_0]|nr:hypothetical protein [Limnothrix sp. RL_2_0]